MKNRGSSCTNRGYSCFKGTVSRALLPPLIFSYAYDFDCVEIQNIRMYTLLSLTPRCGSDTAGSDSALWFWHRWVWLCAVLLTPLSLTPHCVADTAESDSALCCWHCWVWLHAVLLTLLSLTPRCVADTAESDSALCCWHRWVWLIDTAEFYISEQFFCHDQLDAFKEQSDKKSLWRT